METLLLVAHVLVAAALIVLVLLQQGKGADAGATFGGGAGASSSVFGARGASSFLSRTTAMLATLFFVISLVLASVATRKAEDTGVSTKKRTEQTQKKQAPAGKDGVPSAPGKPAGGAVPAAPQTNKGVPTAPAPTPAK